MIVYWSGCIASMIAVYACVRSSLRERHRWIPVFLSALPMILVAALRYDVGEDYLRTYVAYFESVQQSQASSYAHLEPLYHLLNLIVVWLHGGSVWIFAVTAIIFYAAVYAQIFDESPDPLLSVFLIVGMGYCFVFFTAMRQMVGCSILLYSMRYIRQRKLLPFLLCAAVATGFHTSCAMFVVMYWVGRIRIRPMAAILIAMAVAVASRWVGMLLRWIVSQTQYAVYLLSVFDTGETAYVMLAINAVLLAFMAFCYRDDAKYQMYFNMQLAALLVTILSGKVVLILRCLWMFGLPAIIALPVAVENLPLEERERKMIVSVIVILYFAYASYTVGVQNSNNVLPYQTIFSRWIS